MGDRELLHARCIGKVAEVDARAWDALANPDPARFNPFVAHAFLKALEDCGAISAKTGWQPRHLLLEDSRGTLVGAAPLYLKNHSYGEYVFDQPWVNAYARAGLRYYPKLQASVPVTPVPGPRLLARTKDVQVELARALVAEVENVGVSSLHVTFAPDTECGVLARAGFLRRLDQQFHWLNEGYACFDDFFATLTAGKRKSIRKERLKAREDGVTFEWLSGRDLGEAHWDAFFAFYMDTGMRKWGVPYLNRAFFSLIGAAMPERILLVLAMRGGRAIAGALNFIGGETLYGRYWGAIEHRPFLHFETCYYQAIDFAIAHGLKTVEAGAQGAHKLMRGYRPVATHSAHWIADPDFRRAIADWLAEEREEVQAEMAGLEFHLPFKTKIG